MPTVLIVDDEQDMRNLIEVMLSKSDFETIAVASGKEAYPVIERKEADIVLLDVMMPGEDGFEVCEKIRKISSIPIIFLTARDGNEDKVKGLTIGGDDYIVKPFTASELIARIQAVLRRAGVNNQKMLERGVIKLDEASRKVYVNNQNVTLTLKEFDLLQLFMRNPNTVFSREQLLEKIWEMDYDGGTRTVDTHIKTLRLKLGKVSKEASEYIQTVWGIGYRFDQV
ncbi:response regulator transcription factor [Ureibacillus sp. FSL K6-8385]|uniref:Response regulator transcription factor n=1 Tax=Ureibacillus terrenus TaxID=118246 RepID=A0A540V3D4_9BACL|nr:response regulator transcription factor [Ureibacillus terrenus]MED3661042.1 response regulator transcription factor [Ureibacillus terrenus]MED3763328.1 response regulator transcription factor [Ureibacillus terrenus]TQE90743.1 response regulator transcription factor [Ureibacillus terrenus]